MENIENKYEELVKAFHLTWDNYPWTARLIDNNSRVLAVNKTVKAQGGMPGQICAKMGAPGVHKGCKRALALSSGEPQYDMPTPGRIRVWIPVDGYPDVVVHFSVYVPQQNEN